MTDGAYQIGGTMLGLSDLEITRACAEAMGLKWRKSPFITEDKWPYVPCEWSTRDTSDDEGALRRYDPLHDDAQAMALVKKFGLDVQHGGGNSNWWRVIKFASLDSTKRDIDSEGVDLNRAICECVAKMREGR